MRSGPRAALVLTASVTIAAVAACNRTAAAPFDAAMGDVGAEAPISSDAGLGDVSDAGASYVRVTCTDLDPTPGPVFEDVECGRMTVTAGRGSSPAVLPVLHMRPRTLNKKEDPVIVLAGGPGQSAISLVREYLFERPFSTLLSQRDVIAIGLRGTDGADPDLSCTEAEAIALSNREVAGGAADSVYAACRKRLASETGQSTQFGSRQDAADIIAFVGARGIGEWNAYGSSYGTRTAMELARLNPRGLRSIVLDSPVPAEVPLVSESVFRGNEVLSRVLADCERTPSCEAAFPNSAEMLASVLDRFAATPERRRLSTGIVVTIDDSQILFLLQTMLSFRAGAEQVPLMIDAIDDDVSQVDELFQAIIVADRASSDGLYLSVACREIPRGDVDPSNLMDPFLGKLAEVSHTAAAFDRLCGIWGVQYGDVPQAVSSAIPTLILTGELDPAVRPEWADRVATALVAAQPFTIPGEAHTPGDSLCGSRVLQAFMESPRQQVSEACVSQPRPLRFAVP